MSSPREPQTVAAANGIAADEAFGAVTPPIYLSSTFAFAGFERGRDYEYTRTANPSRDMLADTLAKLEGGAGAVVTWSGMAAIDLVLSRLGRDELILAPHDCYGGTSGCSPLDGTKDSSTSPTSIRTMTPHYRRPWTVPFAGTDRNAEQPTDAHSRYSAMRHGPRLPAPRSRSTIRSCLRPCSGRSCSARIS